MTQANNANVVALVYDEAATNDLEFFATFVEALNAGKEVRVLLSSANVDAAKENAFLTKLMDAAKEGGSFMLTSSDVDPFADHKLSAAFGKVVNNTEVVSGLQSMKEFKIIRMTDSIQPPAQKSKPPAPKR